MPVSTFSSDASVSNSRRTVKSTWWVPFSRLFAFCVALKTILWIHSNVLRDPTWRRLHYFDRGEMALDTRALVVGILSYIAETVGMPTKCGSLLNINHPILSASTSMHSWQLFHRKHKASHLPCGNLWIVTRAESIQYVSGRSTIWSSDKTCLLLK